MVGSRQTQTRGAGVSTLEISGNGFSGNAAEGSIHPPKNGSYVTLIRLRENRT